MNSLISVCAWCDSIKTAIGWAKKEKAYQIMGISGDVAHFDLTHSICPSCTGKWTHISPKQFKKYCQEEAVRVA